MANTSTTRTQNVIQAGQRPAISSVDRMFFAISRNWIVVFGLFLGIYVILPFLAPIFMQIGWNGPGRTIYFVYSFLCHQLPQRSFFLFGPKAMYSLPEIRAVWQNTTDPLILRQFIGNAGLGWKVAWSDRMVSMFTSTLIFGLLWWPFRQRIKPLRWWGLVLFLLPMAIDGTSHFIGDLAGLGQGFRDSNGWLATLTQNALPASFYPGDALGSFNSWMRLITGVLFGLGVVWFGFHYLDEAFTEMARSLEAKFSQDQAGRTLYEGEMAEIARAPALPRRGSTGLSMPQSNDTHTRKGL